MEARWRHMPVKERPMDDQMMTSSLDDQEGAVLDSEHEHEQLFAVIDPND